MIKLMFEDDKNKYDFLNDVEFYVDMVPYTDTVGRIDEDMIDPNEPMLNGNEYFNVVDARNFLAEYCFNDAVESISTYPYVKSCRVRPATGSTTEGLSNYIDIEFEHPRDVSKQNIDAIYKYTIRFSDHGHDTSGVKPDVLKSIHVVGMKPKNFAKAARSAFNKNLYKAQERIKKFELEKFGKQITFLG